MEILALILLLAMYSSLITIMPEADKKILSKTLDFLFLFFISKMFF